MPGTQRSEGSVRTELFLKLPRELRDEIYADALKVPHPIKSALSILEHIPQPLRNSPIIFAEALETFYKVNTFLLDLDAAELDALLGSTKTRGQPTDHIRHLIVKCTERPTSIQSSEEYEAIGRSGPDRLRWEKLLRMQHLQDLTIWMDKKKDDSLYTLDFGPVLYNLRARKSGFRFTFKLSFDSILREQWNDPRWLLYGQAAEPYQLMGYVDMSDLIDPPSEHDFTYVKEHLQDYWRGRKMPLNRGIVMGLLDGSPEHRRGLAKLYAVKEPEILRCLMAEHFEVYKRIRGKDGK